MTRVTTVAILLRRSPWSESSHVLRLYARELGLVATMARGVRRSASKGRGALGVFTEGTAVVAVRPNRDMQTLCEFAPTDAHLGLARDFRRLAGASVAAELVLRHAGQEPHALLYDTLVQRLGRLEETDPECIVGEVLALGWQIVDLLGFAPELDRCTACGAEVPSDAEGAAMARFDVEAGGIRGPECCAPTESRRIGPVARAQLADLLRGAAPADLLLPAAHLALLDDFVTAHMLGGVRLESFRFLDPGRVRAPAPASAGPRR